MPNLGKAAAAGFLSSPKAVISKVSYIAAGGLKAGTLAGVGAGSALVAGIVVPAMGAGAMITNAMDASEEGHLEEHLRTEADRFRGHLLYAAGGALIIGIGAPLLAGAGATTLAGMVGTIAVPITESFFETFAGIFIAAGTSAATETVIKKTLDCTSAYTCAFKESSLTSDMFGGSISTKSSHSSNSTNSRIRFFTISFMVGKMVEMKRVTFQSKKQLTQKEFKKEIENFLTLIINKTKDELVIDQSVLDKLKNKTIKTNTNKSKNKTMKNVYP